MHDALRKTRGAVAGHCGDPAKRRQLIYAGVGNISAVMLTGGASRSLVSHNGTLGMTAPTNPGISNRTGRPDAVLVMHSDGLQSRWDLSSYAGLISGIRR